MISLIRILTAVGATILRGVVVRAMWVWFVLTQFPQAPTISLVGAVGLSCLVGLFTISNSDLDEMAVKNGEEKWFRRLAIYTFALLILWGQAYIIHLFM